MLSYNRGGSEGTVLGNPGPTWRARKGVREPMVILAELGTGTLGDTEKSSGLVMKLRIVLYGVPRRIT